MALLTASLLFALGLFSARFAAQEQFGCVLWAEDFVTLYTSSKLVLSGQGAEVYKLPRVEEAGVVDLLQQVRPHCGFTWPLEYWLGFLLPVLPFTLFPPQLAYHLWTVLSVALFAFALWRLAKACGVSPWPFWLISLAFFPVIFGLLQGQVHGWQFLAFTEFWLALRQNRERPAGLWLSLQLVKPQFLPLLVLYLVWHRRWRAVAWFTAASVGWLALTIFFAGGWEGVEAYVGMIQRSLADVRNSWALLMPNWRFLAFVLFDTNPLFVLALTTLVSVATVGLLVWSWQKRPSAARRVEPQSLLVLMAAALLVGYQTFVYSAILLLAPALWVLTQTTQTTDRRRRFWSLVLDFTLLAPSIAAMVFAFFFAQGTFSPAVITYTLVLPMVAIFLCGVFVPISCTLDVERQTIDRSTFDRRGPDLRACVAIFPR